MTVLFIYGTLRRGCRAHLRMEESRYLGEAQMRGKLLFVDRYPGFVAGEGLVQGELYEVRDDVLKRLDEYEGCFFVPPDYVREKKTVVTEEGDVREVETYVFKKLDQASYEIPDGDWLEHMKNHPELNS